MVVLDAFACGVTGVIFFVLFIVVRYALHWMRLPVQYELSLPLDIANRAESIDFPIYDVRKRWFSGLLIVKTVVTQPGCSFQQLFWSLVAVGSLDGILLKSFLSRVRLI
jgi:hypothetical protein